MQEQGLLEEEAKQIALSEQPDVTEVMMSDVKNNNPLYKISSMVAARYVIQVFRWNRTKNSRR